MGTRVLQPGDENASANRTQGSGVGISASVADGGFPAIFGAQVTIRVVDGQSAASASTNSFGDVADNVARIQYSLNGGGGWTSISGFTSQIVEVGPDHPESDSDSKGPSDISISVGNVSDLSQIQVRAMGEILVQTSSPTQSASASFTNWEISYQTISAIIDG